MADLRSKMAGMLNDPFYSEATELFLNDIASGRLPECFPFTPMNIDWRGNKKTSHSWRLLCRKHREYKETEIDFPEEMKAAIDAVMAMEEE